MKYIYKIIGLTILGIVLWLMLPKGCSFNAKRSSIDTFYTPPTLITRWIVDTVEVPTPYKVESPTPGDTFWKPALKTKIDTLAILADYYLKRSYNDSISTDSITIYLKESVCKNQLQRSGVGYRWKVPTMTIKEVVVENKQLLFVGVEPNFNTKQLEFGMYLCADFDTERALIGYGYDPYFKQHKFSIKAKIELGPKRKRKK